MAAVCLKVLDAMSRMCNIKAFQYGTVLFSQVLPSIKEQTFEETIRSLCASEVSVLIVLETGVGLDAP